MKEKYQIKLDEIKQDNRDFRTEITERVTFQNDNISSVKSDIGRFLGLFGLFITLILFVAGYVVNGYLVETKKLKKDVEILLSKTKESEKLVKNLKYEIDSNTTFLYKKLQKEEVSFIFDKLKENPNDLGFYFFTLTRSINVKNNEYYFKLKEMYPTANRSNKLLYKDLMFYIAPEQAFVEKSFFHKTSMTLTSEAGNNFTNEMVLKIIDTIFSTFTYNEIINSENINYLVSLLNACPSAHCGDNRIQVIAKNISKDELLLFKNFLSKFSVHEINTTFEKFLQKK